MTLILYAQPYQIGVEGFFFRSIDEWEQKYPTIKDQDSNQVEEFEIQFIEGNDLDCELAKTWGLTQANFKRFFEVAEEWDHYAKISFIIAVGEVGYNFDPETLTSSDYDVDIYFVDSIKELAEQFIEEGVLGEIPKVLECYIDIGKFAYDLSFEYTEIEIANTKLVYRCR